MSDFFSDARLDLAANCNHTPRPLQAMVACDLRESTMMRLALIIAILPKTDGPNGSCGNEHALSRGGGMG